MLKIGAVILILLEISLIKEATIKHSRKKIRYVSPYAFPLKTYIYTLFVFPQTDS